MKRDTVLEYLRSKKEEFRTKYGITALGIYGSVARDEASDESDVDIFYQTDPSFSMGLFEFTAFLRNLESELHSKVDFVNLKSMNPIIKHYAQKDFIYV
jgi:uncharacterized protein